MFSLTKRGSEILTKPGILKKCPNCCKLKEGLEFQKWSRQKDITKRTFREYLKCLSCLEKHRIRQNEYNWFGCNKSRNPNVRMIAQQKRDERVSKKHLTKILNFKYRIKQNKENVLDYKREMRNTKQRLKREFTKQCAKKHDEYAKQRDEYAKQRDECNTVLPTFLYDSDYEKNEKFD